MFAHASSRGKMMRRFVTLTMILAVWSFPCAAQTTPGPGEVLSGALTGVWYLPLAAPDLVNGQLADWPGSVSTARTGALVFSYAAWAPEGTKGVLWSRALELIRGTSGGDYDFLAGISRVWGVADLAIPGTGATRLGLSRAELGLARGWSAGGVQAGEIRTINSWVAVVGVPVGNLSVGARIHFLDGSLEDYFSEAGESTRLHACGRGYALDLAMRAPITTSLVGEMAAEATLVNLLGGMAWKGSFTLGGTTRPWSRYERAPTGVALSFEMKPALKRLRSLRMTLESSGDRSPWEVADAPCASPWRVRLGAQLELAPMLAGTGSISLHPGRGPSAAAGAHLRLGQISTDIALAFDNRLSVASRVMVTGRVTF
ncbi:MAG: hypothetical protein H5T95_08960 [Firmicutes bacterium]|nr:hypothetical protein [Bacillota bacterium]